MRGEIRRVEYVVRVTILNEAGEDETHSMGQTWQSVEDRAKHVKAQDGIIGHDLPIAPHEPLRVMRGEMLRSFERSCFHLAEKVTRERTPEATSS